MVRYLIFSLLSLLAIPASASSRAVMETIPATRYTVVVDTTHARVNVATDTYRGSQVDVSLYVATNVVVGDPSGTPVVAYGTGTVVAKKFEGQATSALSATSLAAPPTKCSAGNYPLGVDASGNAQNCTAAAQSGANADINSLSALSLISGVATTQSSSYTNTSPGGLGVTYGVTAGSVTVSAPTGAQALRIDSGYIRLNHDALYALRFDDGSGSDRFWLGTDSNGFAVNDRTAAGVEVLRIKNGGNVGIGTSSPLTTLDVNGSLQIGSGAQRSTFTASGDPSFRGIVIAGGSASGDTYGHFQGFDTSGVQRIEMNSFPGGASYINNTGGLGIGTASPLTLLDVNGAATIRGQETVIGGAIISSMSPTGAQIIAYPGPNSNVAGSVVINDGAAGAASRNYGFYTSNQTVGDISLLVGPSKGAAPANAIQNWSPTQSYFPSGINFGIGTASPATTLDVNGNAQFGSGATKSTFTALGVLRLGNVASGTQCLHADSSGNVSGTGGDCGGAGSAQLSSTQTWTGSNNFSGSATTTTISNFVDLSSATIYAPILTSSRTVNLAGFTQTNTLFTVAVDTVQITYGGYSPIMVCYSGVMTAMGTNLVAAWSFLVDGKYVDGLTSSIGAMDGSGASAGGWQQGNLSGCYMIPVGTVAAGVHKFNFTTRCDDGSGTAIRLGQNGVPATKTGAYFFVYELH